MPDKIMVVDDEADIRQLLSNLLTGEGYTVFTAKDGSQGLSCFRQNNPDLVITDIKMPICGGIDLLKGIKATGSDVDVIVLTGHSDERTAIDCLHCGAYDYLLKPLEDLDVLIASVQRALQKRHLEAKNSQLIKQLEVMAIKDPLTGLYNYRHFHTCLSEEIARSERFSHNFVLLMADIDQFKKVNDTYGHMLGDFVLKQTARLLENDLRQTDTLFRYGGEEFVIILPETDAAEAACVMTRLLESLRNHSFSCDQVTARITVSMGAALFPNEATDSTSLVGLADRRLYRAKKSGCDCFDFEKISVSA